MGNTGVCPACRKCMEYIHLMLDGESTSEQDEYVSEHLSGCASCLNDFEVEKQLRQMLKLKLSFIDAPSTLADEIKAKIRSGNQ